MDFSEEPRGSGAARVHRQAVRRAFIEVLADYERRVNPADPEQVFPVDMARRLRRDLERLCEGDTVPWLQPHIPTGGRGNRLSAAQSLAVKTAVAYLVAVDLGLISDPRSRTTIAEAFGVGARQVTRWLKRAGSPKQRLSILEDVRHLHHGVRLRDSDLPRVLLRLVGARGAIYQGA